MRLTPNLPTLSIRGYIYIFKYLLADYLLTKYLCLFRVANCEPSGDDSFKTAAKKNQLLFSLNLQKDYPIGRSINIIRWNFNILKAQLHGLLSDNTPSVSLKLEKFKLTCCCRPKPKPKRIPVAYFV